MNMLHILLFIYIHNLTPFLVCIYVNIYTHFYIKKNKTCFGRHLSKTIVDVRKAHPPLLIKLQCLVMRIYVYNYICLFIYIYIHI